MRLLFPADVNKKFVLATNSMPSCPGAHKVIDLAMLYPILVVEDDPKM